METLGWNVVGAAVQGTSHVKAGLPCQDAAAHSQIQLADGSQVLLAAIADGAGSAARSELGAQTAVHAAMEYLTQALLEGTFEQPDPQAEPAGASEEAEPQPELDIQAAPGSSDVPLTCADAAVLLRRAFSAARQKVMDLSEQEDITPRDLSATLSLALVLEKSLAVGQLGDGCVVAAWEDGATQALTRPQRGEYANETYFLTQEDALEQVEIQAFERQPAALALMSDGLLRLALDLSTYTPHVPFFKPLFSFAAAHGNDPEATGQLETFLNSDRVNTRTDDDKSLVLAVANPRK